MVFIPAGYPSFAPLGNAPRTNDDRPPASGDPLRHIRPVNKRYGSARRSLASRNKRYVVISSAAAMPAAAAEAALKATAKENDFETLWGPGLRKHAARLRCALPHRRRLRIPEKQPAEDAIRDIRRATRRYFSAEEKIRVVLEGLSGEESIAELCRREGIASFDVLRLVEGVPGGGQEATRWRHGARCDFRRGEGSPPRSASVEGGRGRSHPRKPTAQKTYGPPRFQGV